MSDDTRALIPITIILILLMVGVLIAARTELG